MGAQTMLRASDVDIAEGTWVKDLHCSLVSLPMLWPYTSVNPGRLFGGGHTIYIGGG